MAVSLSLSGLALQLVFRERFAAFRRCWLVSLKKMLGSCVWLNALWRFKHYATV